MIVAKPKTKRGTFVIWYTTRTKETLVGPQPKLKNKFFHFYEQFTLFLVSDIILTNKESFCSFIEIL